MFVGVDPLDFTWGDGSFVPPPTGQSPRATRYAKRYRVNWIIRGLAFLAVLGGGLG